VLPLFHALAQMANLLLPLAAGARVVFLETVSSTSLLGALQSRGVTIFACVPQFFYLIHQRVSTEVESGGALRQALFRALLRSNAWLRDHASWNPGRLIFARVHAVLGARMRVLVTGGSRFDPAIGRDLYGMGFTLLNAYGLTETSGGATIVRPGDRFTTSVGQAFPGVEIRIADRPAADANSDPGEGDDGEILIRGPIVMREYFRRPDATAEAIDAGWLRTGDLGRLDDRGRLFITGRKKEIIVLASGKNLYPEEIEAHYRAAPIVKELCVLGLTRPGQPAAERLHAVVVPDEAAMRERGVVNLRELVRFELESLSVQLPAHKRILSYDISLEPLPRTSTGKIKRHEVERRARERAATAERPVAARALSAAEQAWIDAGPRAEIVGTIASRLVLPQVAPDANLELDLGLDSMERVELLTFLEQRRHTRVPPEVRRAIFTVRQLVDAVIDAPAAEGPPAAPADEAGEGSGAWNALLADPPDADLVSRLTKPTLLRSIVFFVVMRACGLVARLVPGFRVSGREHLPAAGPFLICPNHEAYLDAFFLAAALPFGLFRQVFFVGASEYFETRVMGWLARALNIVPVDPDANLVNAMRAGAAGLRLGKVLILFPEGERTIDGEIKAFRKGAAILSSHLDVPMVPASIDGLYEVWPRGRAFDWRRLLPGRSEPVTLRFGAPIRATPGDYASGTEALRREVSRLKDEGSVSRFAPGT
jgi:long-chain acyl-CoA synthetase